MPLNSSRSNYFVKTVVPFALPRPIHFQKTTTLWVDAWVLCDYRYFVFLPKCLTWKNEYILLRDHVDQWICFHRKAVTCTVVSYLHSGHFCCMEQYGIVNFFCIWKTCFGYFSHSLVYWCGFDLIQNILEMFFSIRVDLFLRLVVLGYFLE